MNQIILKYKEDFREYEIQHHSINHALEFIYYALAPSESRWRMRADTWRKDKVEIYDFEYIKNFDENISFKNEEHKKFMLELYDQYQDRRREDMPTLFLSMDNYNTLKDDWKIIKQQKPQYLIIRLDDAGWASLEGKDILSEQDLAQAEREQEVYNRYIKAQDRYLQDLCSALPLEYQEEFYCGRWRCPGDEEYESEIARYMQEDLDAAKKQ